jgi:hypothetical protein
MKFEVTTSSPAFPSSEGLAYFAAFKLPASANRLEVQALYGGHLPNATYPDPLLVILDRNKRPIAEMKDLPLVRGRHVIIRGLFEYHYAATVALPPGAEHVVVFVRPKSGRVQSAVSDNGTLWSVPSAPIGTLAVIAS